MPISRSQLMKELEPGLNALFGLEYNRYEGEWNEVFDTESSDRAFEEEVMLSGFGQAPVKAEGAAEHSLHSGVGSLYVEHQRSQRCEHFEQRVQ